MEIKNAVVKRCGFFSQKTTTVGKLRFSEKSTSFDAQFCQKHLGGRLSLVLSSVGRY